MGKNIRKRRCQSGLDYTSSRGKRVAAKRTKMFKDCKGKCRYQCAWHISNEDIQNIHTYFWSLTDDQKLVFYAETTERIPKGNRKKTRENKNSVRKFTYKFYMKKKENKIQVCKEFYVGILGINISRVRKYYDKLEQKKELRDMRGRYTKPRISECDIAFVKEHINSFNRVPAHYCRSGSSKEFFENSLNMSKMYDMYQEECAKKKLNPVKRSMYNTVFSRDFNIGFKKPKKDRCDLCEEIKVRNMHYEPLNEKTTLFFKNHMCDKLKTKQERDKDRNITCETTAIVCFDLENVLSLPRAEISNFFYKRKFNAYNLTAYCSLDKSVYNAILTEADAGRGSNEIASAIVTILHDIQTAHPHLRDYILWSDSCVPQNRNSIMSFALKHFIKSHNNINTITQKFGCPGHSSVQEVDSAHSHIEKVIRSTEVFSPISLVRVLNSVGSRRRGQFHVIQMRPSSFYDFQKCTNLLKFGSIPYTKVKSLIYCKDEELEILYKLSFVEDRYHIGKIDGKCITRKSL